MITTTQGQQVAIFQSQKRKLNLDSHRFTIITFVMVEQSLFFLGENVMSLKPDQDPEKKLMESDNMRKNARRNGSVTLEVHLRMEKRAKFQSQLLRSCFFNSLCSYFR